MRQLTLRLLHHDRRPAEDDHHGGTGDHHHRPPSTTTTTTAPTTSTTSQVSVLSAITAAVVAFETKQGVPSGQYLVQGVTVSTTDPTWAKFQVNAAPSSQPTFQSAYGIAHDQGGWTVAAIGSSGVGCSGAGAVPTSILQELGLSCP